MNKDSSHMSFETMTEMALENLPANEQAQFRIHLNACVECATEFSRLEKLTAVMLNDSSVNAPPDLIGRVQKQFENHFSEKPSAIRRILAVLLNDSARMTPAFGVRSAQTESRQLLYVLGDNDLDLRISPAENKWLIAGQIFGKIENGTAALVGENITEETALNELGEFAFPPVAAGKYALHFEIGAEEFEISEINVGM